MVVRTQRLKFSKLKRALAHRFGESEVEPLYSVLREAETLGGQKNLRKNASLVELVVAYSEEESRRLSTPEALEKEKGRLLSQLSETLGFSPTSVVALHQTDGRYHFHILFVPRNSEGKKVDWSYKLHSQYLQRVLPSQDLSRLKSKSKKLGAYPLWTIRELESIYGRKETKKLIRLARRKGLNTQELLSSHENLFKELQEKKTKRLKRSKRRWRGLSR